MIKPLGTVLSSLSMPAEIYKKHKNKTIKKIIKQ